MGDFGSVLWAVGWLPAVDSALQRAEYASRALLFTSFRDPDRAPVFNDNFDYIEEWLGKYIESPRPPVDEVRRSLFELILYLGERSG